MEKIQLEEEKPIFRAIIGDVIKKLLRKQEIDENKFRLVSHYFERDVKNFLTSRAPKLSSSTGMKN